MKRRGRVIALTLLVLWVTSLTAQTPRELEKGFVHPPSAAWPWVYWFPLDGNLSREGITADLEAMKRVGIGGVLYMETDQGAPKGPARFAGPLWREMFQHICNEAHRLGLQVNMNNDAGWCGSGGPWITPELSMQKVVWTETEVTGPQRFEAVLPQPKATRDYYRDIAVLAYPTPATSYTIPHLQGKSAATREEIPLRTTFPALAGDAIIRGSLIPDLTTKLGQDGRLAWDVPAGRWTLLRLGHTSTGKDNHPAPLEGRGLECDKLSREAVEVHFNALMGRLIVENKKLTGEKRTLVSTHIDSWEVGSQNWTPKFRAEFRRRRGYDLWPWLPVMTGRVVGSVEESERFLWDVRMTVNDLLLENYAGHFRTLARRHGIRLSIEAYDGPCDDMSYAGRADEPMGEWWSYAPYSGAHWCTEMASAAHVYGKPILGAEAFTATNVEKWQAHPGSIKAMGDWAFCEGVNRFVFHRYALQPWTNPDRAPGMSMGPWGLHYERTQTWWEQSRAWHEYLARCQYLLQQGRFVADLCFLAPENAPQRFNSPVKAGHDRPGYNFDGCPPEVVLTRMKVQAGRLVLPGGMSYRMLVLPHTRTMTPQLLRTIRDLVKAGATVLGAPPVKSPSLQDYPKCDEEVRTLARELWGEEACSVPVRAYQETPDGVTGTPKREIQRLGNPTTNERSFGKGRVIWGREIQIKEEAAYDGGIFSSAKWIWFKEGNPVRSAPPATRYFRRMVAVEGEVEFARLLMTADNTFECWVNGRRAGAGDQFKRAYAMNIESLLKPGANVIAVAATNTTDNPSPAGLIGELVLKYRGGRTQKVTTDATWEAAQTVSGDWKADTAPSPSWGAALELGPMGMAPWGDVEEGPGTTDTTPDISIPSRVLEKMGVPPDFRCDPNGLRYIHKCLGETDVYFVSNPQPREVETSCTFRVAGKQPELWWPDTGRVEPASQFGSKGDSTTVPLRLDPSGSVFVVFRRATRGIQPIANGHNWLDFKPMQEIAGSWEVTFDPKWGGPEKPVLFEKLEDWSQRPESGVRYYSGTAVYHKAFSIPQSEIRNPKSRVFLDLGRVEVMAQVKLNSKDLGILWKTPYRVEVTDAIRPGDNTLEIAVVDLWINRQIGDEQLPEDSDRHPNGTLKEWPKWVQEGKPSPTGRYTFTSWRLWKKDDPLVPSGLLGPVTLFGATP